MPVAWCLATPNIGECEVAAELLAHAARTGALRPGLLALAAVVRHNWAAAERIKRSLTTYDH
jgi:hypothetical protein